MKRLWNSVAAGLVLPGVLVAQASPVVEKSYDVRDLTATALAGKGSPGGQEGRKAEAAKTRPRPGSRSQVGSPPKAVAVEIAAVPEPKLRVERGVAELQAGKPTMDELQRFLAAAVRPALGDRDRVDGFRGTLHVATDPRRHACLQGILAANRNRKVGGQLRAWSTVLDAKRRGAVQRFTAEEESAVLSGPRQEAWRVAAPALGLQKHAAQTVAGIRSLRWVRRDRTRFVKDYELEVGNSSFKVAPVLGVLQHGFEVDVQIGWLDAERLSVQARYQHAEVVRPVKVVQVDVGAGTHRLKVQLPRTEVVRRSQRAELRSGETLLLRFPMDGKRELVLVMTLTGA